MTHPFVDGFFDEIEKLAAGPLAALAVPALKSIGTGAAMTAGSAAVSKMMQPKQPKPNKGFEFQKSAAMAGALTKAIKHPVGNMVASGAIMTGMGMAAQKMMEPRKKKQDNGGQFQYEQ